MASGRQGNFSVEFREQMVALYLEQQDAKTLSQVAREHGIGPETLRVWVKKHRALHPVGEKPLTVSERDELTRLRREVADLRLEREFLGKATAFFARKYR